MYFSPTRLAFGVLTFSKGIGWCRTSGRFPRRRRLVPPAPAARFPQNSILAAQKHLGACFWGHKKPLREWGHALPRFSSQKHSFGLYKSPGACFWGHKKPLREWGHALPRFYSQKHGFWLQKTLGRAFGGTKIPRGNGDTHSLVLGK